MAINTRIPKSSKLCIVGGVFKAVLNDPAIGKYDFTNYKIGGTRFNVAVDLGLNMNPSYLYFFHQLHFSLSIPEGDFLAAIESGTVPILSIKDSSSRKNLFQLPFRLFRFFENAAIDDFHFNLNANAQLLADFQAVLVQTVDLVGIDTVYAQVSASIYEITDEKYIKEYKREAGN